MSLTNPAMQSCFKQADVLGYTGGSKSSGGDYVGWHNHGGESLLFAVVVLSEPSDYAGGQFCCKRCVN